MRVVDDALWAAAATLLTPPLKTPEVEGGILEKRRLIENKQENDFQTKHNVSQMVPKAFQLNDYSDSTWTVPSYVLCARKVHICPCLRGTGRKEGNNVFTISSFHQHNKHDANVFSPRNPASHIHLLPSLPPPPLLSFPLPIFPHLRSPSSMAIHLHQAIQPRLLLLSTSTSTLNDLVGVRLKTNVSLSHL